MKKWIFLGLLALLVATPGLCVDTIKLPCEVMEVSPAFKTSSPKIRDVRYVLLHHANSADRVTLSKWLKDRSGTEVTFIAGHRQYRGVLFRLAHCFGRGLLVYAADVKLAPRDIINVVLPLSP
ncbi:MAG: hypothetical protein JRI79_15585 [Deltaproteobacteria bacterium]|nr:hypothetical protein [Deltaproteobacteria bacterium]MBW2300778.1 hypothetical protein [Deltaproteobacteria bacterium]